MPCRCIKRRAAGAATVGGHDIHNVAFAALGQGWCKHLYAVDDGLYVQFDAPFAVIADEPSRTELTLDALGESASSRQISHLRACGHDGRVTFSQLFDCNGQAGFIMVDQSQLHPSLRRGRGEGHANATAGRRDHRYFAREVSIVLHAL
jgi:hypothetical protein